MQKFTELTATAVPLDSANIDTDQIIPKQFLLAVTRKGFGKHMFHDWRYLDDAETKPNPDFNLNKAPYQGAQILVARDNFGCGSSREHAPWALIDYGFKAVIAPSFANIFFNNSMNNGLVLVKLTEAEVDEIIQELTKHPGSKIKVSLVDMTVECNHLHFTFDLDPFRRQCLLEGLDNISLTLQHESEISAFEQKQPAWKEPDGQTKA